MGDLSKEMENTGQEDRNRKLSCAKHSQNGKQHSTPLDIVTVLKYSLGLLLINNQTNSAHLLNERKLVNICKSASHCGFEC